MKVSLRRIGIGKENTVQNDQPSRSFDNVRQKIIFESVENKQESIIMCSRGQI